MGEEIGRNTKWFYNLKTGRVEPEGQSKAKDLLGPFPDQQTAARALDIVHEREKRLREQDLQWEQGDQN